MESNNTRSAVVFSAETPSPFASRSQRTRSGFRSPPPPPLRTVQPTNISITAPGAESPVPFDDARRSPNFLLSPSHLHSQSSRFRSSGTSLSPELSPATRVRSPTVAGFYQPAFHSAARPATAEAGGGRLAAVGSPVNRGGRASVDASDWFRRRETAAATSEPTIGGSFLRRKRFEAIREQMRVVANEKAIVTTAQPSASTATTATATAAAASYPKPRPYTSMYFSMDDSPEAPVPYWRQGDWRMYSDAMLTKRESLRSDPLINRSIRRWWECIRTEYRAADAAEVVTKDVYVNIMAELYKFLVGRSKYTGNPSAPNLNPNPNNTASPQSSHPKASAGTIGDDTAANTEVAADVDGSESSDVSSNSTTEPSAAPAIDNTAARIRLQSSADWKPSPSLADRMLAADSRSGRIGESERKYITAMRLWIEELEAVSAAYPELSLPKRRLALFSAEALREAEDDWRTEVNGSSETEDATAETEIMSQAVFCQSLFQLADIWCLSTSPLEYAYFLERIREWLFYKLPTPANDWSEISGFASDEFLYSLRTANNQPIVEMEAAKSDVSKDIGRESPPTPSKPPPPLPTNSYPPIELNTTVTTAEKPNDSSDASMVTAPESPVPVPKAARPDSMRIRTGAHSPVPSQQQSPKANRTRNGTPVPESPVSPPMRNTPPPVTTDAASDAAMSAAAVSSTDTDRQSPSPLPPPPPPPPFPFFQFPMHSYQPIISASIVRRTGSRLDGDDGSVPMPAAVNGYWDSMESAVDAYFRHCYAYYFDHYSDALRLSATHAAAASVSASLAAVEASFGWAAAAEMEREKRIAMLRKRRRARILRLSKLNQSGDRFQLEQILFDRLRRRLGQQSTHNNDTDDSVISDNVIGRQSEDSDRQPYETLLTYLTTETIPADYQQLMRYRKVVDVDWLMTLPQPDPIADVSFQPPTNQSRIEFEAGNGPQFTATNDVNHRIGDSAMVRNTRPESLPTMPIGDSLQRVQPIIPLRSQSAAPIIFPRNVVKPMNDTTVSSPSRSNSTASVSPHQSLDKIYRRRPTSRVQSRATDGRRSRLFDFTPLETAAEATEADPNRHVRLRTNRTCATRSVSPNRRSALSLDCDPTAQRSQSAQYTILNPCEDDVARASDSDSDSGPETSTMDAESLLSVIQSALQLQPTHVIDSQSENNSDPVRNNDNSGLVHSETPLPTTTAAAVPNKGTETIRDTTSSGMLRQSSGDGLDEKMARSIEAAENARWMRWKQKLAFIGQVITGHSKARGSGHHHHRRNQYDVEKSNESELRTLLSRIVERFVTREDLTERDRRMIESQQIDALIDDFIQQQQHCSAFDDHWSLTDEHHSVLQTRSPSVDSVISNGRQSAELPTSPKKAKRRLQSALSFVGNNTDVSGSDLFGDSSAVQMVMDGRLKSPEPTVGSGLEELYFGSVDKLASANRSLRSSVTPQSRSNSALRKKKANPPATNPMTVSQLRTSRILSKTPPTAGRMTSIAAPEPKIQSGVRYRLGGARQQQMSANRQRAAQISSQQRQSRFGEHQTRINLSRIVESHLDDEYDNDEWETGQYLAREYLTAAEDNDASGYPPIEWRAVWSSAPQNQSNNANQTTASNQFVHNSNDPTDDKVSTSISMSDLFSDSSSSDTSKLSGSEATTESSDGNRSLDFEDILSELEWSINEEKQRTDQQQHYEQQLRELKEREQQLLQLAGLQRYRNNDIESDQSPQTQTALSPPIEPSQLS